MPGTMEVTCDANPGHGPMGDERTASRALGSKDFVTYTEASFGRHTIFGVPGLRVDGYCWERGQRIV